MKKNFTFFLVLSAFIACKSKTKSPVTDSAANNIHPKDNAVTLVQKFKPFIQGVWVKSDYIDKVVKTKSPLAAKDLASGLTTMYIETDSIKGDSMVVKAGWNNHEGSDLYLKFKPGKTSETILLGDYDFGYSTKNGDTTLILYAYDKEKNEHTTSRYIKALIKQSDNLGDGMDYLINKAVVAGKYKLIDSLNTHVTFTNSGKVSGLANFTTFSISNDFVIDVMSNLDEISFTSSGKAQVDYTFKINKDTLSIYNTRANSDSTELIIDKLKYKLVKQR